MNKRQIDRVRAPVSFALYSTTDLHFGFIKKQARGTSRDASNQDSRFLQLAHCTAMLVYIDDSYTGYDRPMTVHQGAKIIPHCSSIFILPKAYSQPPRSTLANYQLEAQHTLHALDSSPDATC